MNNEPLLWMMLAAGIAGPGVQARPADRPNVVFFLADDLGWGDLGCYGQPFILTPNLDALATDGLRFTRCYAGSSVSAPSRSCLITGTHTGHTAVRVNTVAKGFPEGQFPLPDSVMTIFHSFREAGYVTGVFGKWGLGPVGSMGDPLKHGVDHFFGYNCQELAHSYYPDHLWDNDRFIPLEGNSEGMTYGEGTYAPDVIQEEALRFLEVAAGQDQPFFLMYPTNLPHAELISPKDSIFALYEGKFRESPFLGADEGNPRFRKGGYCSQPYPLASYASMVTRLDAYVGQIVNRLKELDIYDNTLIIFASDNGPHREGGAGPDFFNSNGPWRGYKADLYEGGIRVPLIVSWKGHIQPGRTTDHLCAFWDFMPTFRDLLGEKTDSPSDGISLMPLLRGKIRRQKKHASIYFEFLRWGRNPTARQAYGEGKWKLIRLNVQQEMPAVELYNLVRDPGETTDVAEKYPGVVARMLKGMEAAHRPHPDFPLLWEELKQETWSRKAVTGHEQ
ncbi:MAG: arylsulfatase [Bacteroidales bacterium]|nr:arylsulfatase [Bacteroidales bacterium]